MTVGSETFGARGRVTLSGGAGDDLLAAYAISGTARVNGGTGNDRLALNGGDVEMRNVRGGHTIARGGPGNDEFRGRA